MTTTSQKITFAELRASGVRNVLSTAVATTSRSAPWPHHVRLSDIEPDFVRTRCGKRGAEVRPSTRRDEQLYPHE